MSRSLAAFALVASMAAVASADRLPLRFEPRVPAGSGIKPAAVSSNVIFLDPCTNGCSIRPGNDDSRTDSSSVPPGTTLRTLTKSSCGDAVFTQAVACVNDIFHDFNVQITTTDPGSQTHLEVKVAGTYQQLGIGPAGGIAPFACLSYEDNALVFVFPEDLACDVNEVCSAIAQEIAHTWSLDHVVNPADPLTYFGYNTTRYFSDGTQCGSDCYNSSGNLCKVGDSGCRSGLGNAACTTAQVHPCFCTGSTGQNDHAKVLSLFGASTPMPPVVKITKPLEGAALAPGFAVDADITSPYTITNGTMTVDGMPSGSLNAGPFIFNAPASLAPGQHTVQVSGTDKFNVTGSSQINIIIGNPCTKASECPDSTQTCVGGRCVAGSTVPGGLGSTCTMPSDCLEGQCASDGTNMYCTTSCTPGQCPSGYGCLPTGTGSGSSSNAGVCWPNYDDGSGGGGCSTTGGGPLVLGLVSLGLVLSRRRCAR
jgi:hypothetical protein